MAVMGVVAHFTKWVFIFPSLGPSVFLIFYFPSSPMASPKNTIVGHFAGLIIGYASYQFLHSLGFASHQGLMIASSGLSMGLLGVFMVYSGILHPPAASTCLIASLGLVKSVSQMVGMVLAVYVICMIGYVVNWLAGIEYPLWESPDKIPLPKIKTVLGDVQELESEDEIERIAARLAMRQKVDDDQ